MTAWLIQNMAAASLMMLVVLAIRTPVARAFGAGWAYALWLLPLVRLIMPPLTSIGGDIPSILPSLLLTTGTDGAAAPLPLSAGSGQWVPIFFALWAAGAAVFILFQFLSYRSFLTRLSLASRSAGAYRGLPLIESDVIEGPIAVGLLDRRIVVPADFASRYSEAERRLAAEHEHVHHRRGDIWWNLAALAVLALNWFNPIAWVSFVAFRADQELACDAAVASDADGDDRHAYASALIKSASRPGAIAVCPLNHADQLKRRLKMMNNHRSNRLRTIGGAASFALLAGLAASLAAPAIAHPHPDDEGYEGKAGSRGVVVMERVGGDHPRRGLAEVINPDVLASVERCHERDGGIHDEQRGGNRILVVCGAGEGGNRTEALRRMRERLANDPSIEEATRRRIVEALDGELGRARAD